MKKTVFFACLMLSAVGFAQNQTTTVSQDVNDRYAVIVTLDEATEINSQGISFISGVIEFNDVYEVKYPEDAERLREQFSISLDVREGPMAIMVGENIWLEANIQQVDSEEVIPDVYEHPQTQSSDQLTLKISSSNNIVLARVQVSRN